jgi:hypothetical protein
MLAERLLKTAGNKPNKNAFANLYFRKAYTEIRPEGMSPFEYWLAHLNPEDMQRR